MNKIVRRKNAMEEYNNDEFNWIIQPIIDNKEYQKLKEVSHHGSTRFDHSMRVAYYTYLTAKFFHLDDYQATTKAALLHDFFIDEVKDKNIIARLRKHPSYAAEKAKEHFGLNEKQIDIIKTHMFPITFTPPKYIEGWIVDIVDDVVAVGEKAANLTDEFKTTVTFMFILLINFLNTKL